MAADGTEQGFSGWYYDELGHQLRYEVDDWGGWTLMEKYKEAPDG